MVFTWPDRPTRWSCSPDHIINKDVHLTNQANQLTIVFTCNTRFPVTQGDLTRSPNQEGWKSLTHVTQPANWHWCSPDQSGQVGQTDDIVVHSTNYVNQVENLFTWPYHQHWCQLDQSSQPDDRDINLTNQITQDNQMKLVFTWPSRWNCCSPDHIMNNEVHLTWSSADLPDQPGEATDHLTLPWTAENH